MTRFDKLKEYAERHWGLLLVKNDPGNRGYWNGCWKSGYGLGGKMPGSGHSWRRFATLNAIAKAIGFKE